MKKEAPNYLLKLILKCEKLLEQEQLYTNVQLSNWLFQAFFFSIYPKWLAQFRCEQKKLRVNFNI